MRLPAKERTLMVPSAELLICAAVIGAIAICAFAGAQESPPTSGPLGNLYPREPALYPAKLALLAVILAGGITRAGVRFGLISEDLYLRVQPVGRVAIAAALMAFLVLLAHARFRSRRAHAQS
jgi:hypothetical protein